MNDHDQLAALYQEQEREIADALHRMETGMGTTEDVAILRCALGLSPKPRQVPPLGNPPF